MRMLRQRHAAWWPQRRSPKRVSLSWTPKAMWPLSNLLTTRSHSPAVAHPPAAGLDRNVSRLAKTEQPTSLLNVRNRRRAEAMVHAGCAA